MSELTRVDGRPALEVLSDTELPLPEHTTQSVALVVDLPSEFQALLSGLSRIGGKDASGNHTKIWAVDGIDSIDFAQSEPGISMVFNLSSGYEAEHVYLRLTEWLVDLRHRRQQMERKLASSSLRASPNKLK